MAYINVAEWSPDQVTDWIKGLFVVISENNCCFLAIFYYIFICGVVVIHTHNTTTNRRTKPIKIFIVSGSNYCGSIFLFYYRSR